MDRHTKRALHELSMGAAALGFCIARTLGRYDPKLLGDFAEEAKKMYDDLSRHGKTATAEPVLRFYLALVYPERDQFISSEAD